MELNQYFERLVIDTKKLCDDISGIIVSKNNSGDNKKERSAISKRSLERSYVLRSINENIDEDPDIQFIIDQTNNIFRE